MLNQLQTACNHSPRNDFPFKTVRDASERKLTKIDLQIIASSGRIDLVKTRETCERLFAGRHAQMWPAPIVQNEGWEGLYSAQAEGLDVLQDVNDAIGRANRLIADIASA